ncbi:hypothetical protein K439DRAFT_1650093 [Ramaria rubella]|nr:hypothetical protein K439DRAFT_1650093 [Ramaria rubella]
MNIILAGDFAQPPPISQYTLYSGSIGTKKLQGVTNEIQEATIGKPAWHQFTTVVILRENMQQRNQTPEDRKLKRALQNMRYKACTTTDISFLKTLVGGRPANKVKLNQARFRNVSIIVGPNAHRDKYNMLGSVRYANDTKQPLHHFYSMDTLGSPKQNDNHRNISKARMKDPRRASNVLSPELQHILWNLPHAASQHCAGKLSLLKHNIATPCCVTNGAEELTKDKKILDVLFVKLKNPPSPIKLDGLPLNVVPIGRAAQDVICCLPNDDMQVCLTHQSYYTSLSRSASASGTPKKIMGGCSGWLRQEFRELERLDEINKLRYEKKLPNYIIGDRRNTIIREYQLWKGTNYVPKHVHAALHWHWQLLHSSFQEIEDGAISLERARDRFQQDFH